MLAMMNNRTAAGNTCQQPIQNPNTNSANNEIYSNYSVKQTAPTSSGSETDVSTSTENLSPEEHYVLKNSQRQEPQGEETYFNNDCLSSPLNTNTLIIHGNDSLQQQQISNNNSIYSYMSPAPSYFFGGKRPSAGNLSALNNGATTDVAGNPVNKKSDPAKTAGTVDATMVPYHNARALLEQQHQMQQQLSGQPPPPSTPTIMLNDKNDVINLKNNLISLIDNNSHYSNLNLLKYSMNLAATAQSTPTAGHTLFINNNHDSVIKIQSCNDSCSQISTPNNGNQQQQQSAMNLQQPMLNDYLNSLKKNDSLMLKNFNVASLDLPPPSPSRAVVDFEKPTWNGLQIQNANSKSLERFAISRSHPDLSKFSDEDINAHSSNPQQHPSASSIIPIPLNMSPRQRHTIEILLIENSQLRTELDFCYKKLQKFQKVESQIQTIYQSYDELMKSSEKKEKFEREARFKLELELKKLQKQNKCLQERLDSKKTNFDESDFEKELTKRGALISYLLTKNKELINFKERQEIELEAQRLTLQEQRNHIEILDTALINAQNNIMTLENELRKKQGWEEKALFLEKALSNLQSTNERRLQMEKRIRTYLEKELEKLKGTKTAEPQQACGGTDSNKNNNNDVETMKATIVGYEKKIIDLEAEVSKWEQKYLEENTLRSIEVSAASAPKDAKIAALERTSQESEKLIAEARTERLKHMDEIHVANKKCAELESKLKDSNFKLAEKEAIIKVLQKHSDDKDAVLQKTLRFTNVAANSNRHTRSASTMGLVASNNPSSVALKTAHNYSNTELLPRTVDFPGKLREDGDTSAVPSTGAHFATSADQQENLKETDPGTTTSSNNSKDSIINALRNEKERYPNHYNNWRL